LASKNYTDKDIIKHSKNVISLAQLLKKLGLKPAGGNYANMKRNLQRLNVDTSHWKGQAWSKNQQLKDWSNYTRGERLKPHLIRERGYKCECCNLKEWQKEPIPLEVHHKDGDNTNNRYKNLELLCCNCHALTDTWRSRNIQG
jgi:hypothetical protein